MKLKAVKSITLVAWYRPPLICVYELHEHEHELQVYVETFCSVEV